MWVQAPLFFFFAVFVVLTAAHSRQDLIFPNLGWNLHLLQWNLSLNHWTTREMLKFFVFVFPASVRELLGGIGEKKKKAHTLELGGESHVVIRRVTHQSSCPFSYMTAS